MCGGAFPAPPTRPPRPPPPPAGRLPRRRPRGRPSRCGCAGSTRPRFARSGSGRPSPEPPSRRRYTCLQALSPGVLLRAQRAAFYTHPYGLGYRKAAFVNQQDRPRNVLEGLLSALRFPRDLLQRFCPETSPRAPGMGVLPPWVLHAHGCCMVPAMRRVGARRVLVRPPLPARRVRRRLLRITAPPSVSQRPPLYRHECAT